MVVSENFNAEDLYIPFDSRQFALYRCGDKGCVYHSVRWPCLEGRGKYGEFPLVVVRKYYEDRGYKVLASEPRLPDGKGFILLSYPGKRENEPRDPAYTKMAHLLGSDLSSLDDLNREADKAKMAATGNRGGGDPDLFVYRADMSERFFVEAKWKDKLTKKQLATFPIIKRAGWDVKVAWIVENA